MRLLEHLEEMESDASGIGESEADSEKLFLDKGLSSKLSGLSVTSSSLTTASSSLGLDGDRLARSLWLPLLADGKNDDFLIGFGLNLSSKDSRYSFDTISTISCGILSLWISSWWAFSTQILEKDFLHVSQDVLQLNSGMLFSFSRFSLFSSSTCCGS